MPVVPIRRAWLLALWVGLCAIAQVSGQPKPEPPKAAAIKLPDGTIVFLTKNPDDANPPIDGVLLSAADFKALTEKAEQARKTKPAFPSSLAIRGHVEMRGERPVAVMSLAYGFRTTQPRTTVALGCQRAAIVSAKNEQGQLPILNPPGDEGLTVFVETPGEHSLTLQAEVPVLPRGMKNEIGFDLGLPRAAITTLEWAKPSANAAKKYTLGTRIADGTLPKSGEIRLTSVSLEALAKPLALGATDYLEMAWEKPSAPVIADAGKTIEAEIAVRIEDTSVETVAKLRLRGGVKEWPLQLPPNAEVVVERAVPSGIASADTATIVRPTDAAKPLWFLRTPEDATLPEWLATVTVRQLRPKATDPKYRGPYSVGPFFSPTATRQTGRVRVFAPANIRLGYKPAADVRRVDLPAGAEDELLAQFQYTSLAAPAGTGRAFPLLELDSRVSVSAARVRPTHRLKLTTGGWQLETTLKLTPPPRGELEQLLVEMPAGWQKRLEAGPEEIVDSVQVLREEPTRLLAVRFISPQKQPFEITLSSSFPVPAGAKDLAIPLPRFPQAELRETKVSATVADGFEVRGAGFAPESGFSPSEPLKPAVGGKGGAVVSIQGEFERGLERVELSWQSYRPEMACEIRADVTVQDRQTLISETIVFKPTAEDPRPIRLRGPRNAIAWQQSTPPLDPVDTVGSNEWEFQPPAGVKEFVLTVNFAVKHPVAEPGSALRVPVMLFWPDTASRTESKVRVWGGTGSYTAGLVNDGQWMELPQSPVAGREALPWFNLASSSGKVPITIDLTDAGANGLPTVTVERSILLATLADSGTTACRASFLLSRWTGTAVEIQLPAVQSLEVSVDGKRAEGLAPNDAGIVAVPLPEAKAGKSAVIELRYRTPLMQDDRRVRRLPLPAIRKSLSKTAMRWYLASDAVDVPFVMPSSGKLELEWAWRGLGFAPKAAVTPLELEQWFQAGAARDGESSPVAMANVDSLAGRTHDAAAIEFYLLPRFPWILGVSTIALGLGLWITRWPWVRTIWFLGAVGVLAALASALAPQPLAQLVAALQPGLAALALFLAGKLAFEGVLRQRVDRLPAFSRSATMASPPSGSVRESGSRPSRGPIDALAAPRTPSASKG